MRGRSDDGMRGACCQLGEMGPVGREGGLDQEQVGRVGALRRCGQGAIEAAAVHLHGRVHVVVDRVGIDAFRGCGVRLSALR